MSEFVAIYSWPGHFPQGRVLIVAQDEFGGQYIEVGPKRSHSSICRFVPYFLFSV